MPTRCNRGFYCRSYCLLNMFRAPLCPSSGAHTLTTMHGQNHIKLIYYYCVSSCKFFIYSPTICRVGWGIVLQAGWSRVWFLKGSLDFSLTYPSGRNKALGSTQHLTEMSSRNISCWLGVWDNVGRCVGLTTLPPTFADCLEILGSSTLQFSDLSRPSFFFFFLV